MECNVDYVVVMIDQQSVKKRTDGQTGGNLELCSDSTDIEEAHGRYWKWKEGGIKVE